MGANMERPQIGGIGIALPIFWPPGPRGAQSDPNLDLGPEGNRSESFKLSSLKSVGSCLVTRVLLRAIEKHDGKSNARSNRG